MIHLHRCNGRMQNARSYRIFGDESVARNANSEEFNSMTMRMNIQHGYNICTQIMEYLGMRYHIFVRYYMCLENHFEMFMIMLYSSLSAVYWIHFLRRTLFSEAQATGLYLWSKSLCKKLVGFPMNITFPRAVIPQSVALPIQLSNTCSHSEKCIMWL